MGGVWISRFGLFLVFLVLECFRCFFRSLFNRPILGAFYLNSGPEDLIVRSDWRGNFTVRLVKSYTSVPWPLGA